MFKYIIVGILIGLGAILPGVSSGVICIMTGVYEKLIDIMLNFFKNIKSNIKIIIPLGCGIIIGISMFGKVLEYLINCYPVHIKSIFVGLIIGGIPMLIKESKIKVYNNKKTKYISLIVACIIGIAMFVYEKTVNIESSVQVSNMYLIYSGILMSVGIVVPGVSSTVILMCLGVYNIYLNAIANFNFNILVPMGIGVTAGAIMWIKIIKKLFKKYYIQTYYAIIGFTLSSVLVLFPNIYSIYDFSIMIIGIALGIKICKYVD